jgi:hypothetical protein
VTDTIEEHLTRAMQSVADTTAIPPMPQPDSTAVGAHRRNLGRRLTALIAAGGIGVIGVGAATATGVLSHRAKQAFSGWEDINPRDAVLVAKLPGPAGTVVAAYEAPNHSNGQTCIAYLVLHDRSYRGHGVGGECSDRRGDGFAMDGGTVSQIELPGSQDIAVFALSAGRSATATVRYGGQAHPVAVGRGFMVGWVPQSAWGTATLTGRDAAGHTVGELHDLGSDNPDLVIPR